MARSRGVWILAALIAAACAGVAATVWATALRESEDPVDQTLLCSRYAELRTGLFKDGIGADAALRIHIIELADTAQRYPDDEIVRSGDELQRILTVPNSAPTDLLVAVQPIAAECSSP